MRFFSRRAPLSGLKLCNRNRSSSDATTAEEKLFAGRTARTRNVPRAFPRELNESADTCVASPYPQSSVVRSSLSRVLDSPSPSPIARRRVRNNFSRRARVPRRPSARRVRAARRRHRVVAKP